MKYTLLAVLTFSLWTAIVFKLGTSIGESSFFLMQAKEAGR